MVTQYLYGCKSFPFLKILELPQAGPAFHFFFSCPLAVGWVLLPWMPQRHQSWVLRTSAFLTGNTLPLVLQKRGTQGTHQHLGMCWLQGLQIFSKFTRVHCSLSTFPLSWPYKGHYSVLENPMVPRKADRVGRPRTHSMGKKQMSISDGDLGICWSMASGPLALAGDGARHEPRAVTICQPCAS